jgi:hypothetical protein
MTLAGEVCGFPQGQGQAVASGKRGSLPWKLPGPAAWLSELGIGLPIAVRRVCLPDPHVRNRSYRLAHRGRSGRSRGSVGLTQPFVIPAMAVQPDKLKLVTVFRDRHAKGSQPTIDRHLGDGRDNIWRVFIVSSLGEARPESHLAMSPANRGMKALATEEFNVDVQDGAVDGSNSSPLRDSMGQLVEVAEPLSVLGSVLVVAAHVRSDWDEVQAAGAQLDRGLDELLHRVVAQDEDEPLKLSCHRS